MLYDFIVIDKSSKAPLYRQIYVSIRNSIENGSLKKGDKLTSIRRLSGDLGVSKTTITGAYEQLCAEGYIKNKPQSGYYVAAEFEEKPQKQGSFRPREENEKQYFEYDFSGRSIDERIINISEWKKYVKEALNQSYLLTSYGEPQGEAALRVALQKYSLGTRSVRTSAENIVVGAGMQPLLYLLCALLGGGKRVATARVGYPQAEFVFRSAGYEVSYFDSDENGATVSSLDRIKPDLILINPNFTEESGANMPVTRRLELIKWAKENDALIVEDDYNGELRYSTHPMPCVQNYDVDNTVYLGSFSKVLLPSVRIGYMALPDRLLNRYAKIKNLSNQTASKVEQTSLAKYLENGKIDVHLRKARRIYLEKSRLMTECVKEFFSGAEITFNETSLYIAVKPQKSFDMNRIYNALKENSVLIMPPKNDSTSIRLSFSGIDEGKIKDGIKIISQVLNSL